MRRAVGLRWTIGDVTPAGFEALRLSIHGAMKLFGSDAGYAVCVNTIAVEDARARTGPVPAAVEWLPASGLPQFLRQRLDAKMAEGVAWKLAPLRLFPDRYELSLDNDCILWAVPEAVERWLSEKEPRCLIAADRVLAHGAFSSLTRAEPRNTGIRGLPPRYDLGAALRSVLSRCDVPLKSELDEQGLQVVALDEGRRAHVVSLEDVTICSPFWPHLPELGRAGAHFIGLNTRHMDWQYYGKPARECILSNWQRHHHTLCSLVGLCQDG